MQGIYRAVDEGNKGGLEKEVAGIGSEIFIFHMR